MKSQVQRTRSTERILLGWLILTGLGLGYLSGCRQASAPPEGDRPAESVESPAPEKASQPQAGQASLVPVKPGTASAKSEKQVSGQEVFDAMVKAYKTARTYADRGEIRVTGQMGGQTLNFNGYYLVAMERPNKIRIQAYRGTAVCDGVKLSAFIDDLPSQILQTDAQPELSLDWLFGDRNLALAMADGFTRAFSWAPPQTVLLLAADPAKTLLFGAEKPTLIDSGKIDTHECYRLEAKRPDGKLVFWIDQKSHVLRRLEHPTAGINQSMAGGQIRNFSLVAEFVDAQIDGKIDPQSFAFQAPKDSHTVDRFLSPDVALLGKPVPEFKFVDLDGKPVTPASLAGKVTVIDVWATWCGPCRAGLPSLEKVHQTYKDNQKVAFVAVSIDQPQTEDKDLRKTFEELKVTVPISRDPEQHTAQLLMVAGIPAMVVIDLQGTVQDYEIGLQPRLDVDLPAKIEKLLAGKDLVKEKLAKFEQRQKDFETWLRAQIAEDAYWNPPPMEMEIPRAEIADRSEPKSLRLKPLWNLKELREPGNILVIPQPDQAAQVLVIDEGKALVEIAPDGKVAARHALKLPPRGLAGFVRTATGPEEKRWFLCGANGLQQVHLFDGKFEHVLDFPEEVSSEEQAGIADAQLGDLDGDGKPEMCLGYWGVVGVQGVSLEGKRLWANKSLATVLRVALLDPDAKGKRSLLCTNQRGTLALLDAEGKSQSEIGLPDQMIHWVVAADLSGDGKSSLCALAPTPEGDLTVLGLNLKGDLLWLYALPRGVYERPIEPVTAGRLLPGDRGHWIVAGADGSVHLLDADGKLIDRFNYGQTLTGIAGLKWGDRHVLLVATSEGLDAWEVEGAVKP